MSIEIYNCSYEELIKKIKIENMTVDLLLTDPPYNVSRTHQLGFSNMGRSGMNYGDWDYNFDQEKWIHDVSEIIKPGGSVVIFNDWKKFTYIIEVLEKNNFIIKDLIRWIKSNPMPRNVNRRYVGDYEFAIWAVKKGEKWTFNKGNKKAYLRPVFKTSTVPGGKKRLHPTQKSLKLFEDIIKIHSNKGDLVLDLFLGSGTTAEACLNTKRNFIGCEIDINYYNISVKRVEKND